MYESFPATAVCMESAWYVKGFSQYGATTTGEEHNVFFRVMKESSHTSSHCSIPIPLSLRSIGGAAILENDLMNRLKKCESPRKDRSS